MTLSTYTCRARGEEDQARITLGVGDFLAPSAALVGTGSLKMSTPLRGAERNVITRTGRIGVHAGGVGLGGLTDTQGQDGSWR